MWDGFEMYYLWAHLLNGGYDLFFNLGFLFAVAALAFRSVVLKISAIVIFLIWGNLIIDAGSHTFVAAKHWREVQSQQPPSVADKVQRPDVLGIHFTRATYPSNWGYERLLYDLVAIGQTPRLEMEFDVSASFWSGLSTADSVSKFFAFSHVADEAVCEAIPTRISLRPMSQYVVEWRDLGFPARLARRSPTHYQARFSGCVVVEEIQSLSADLIVVLESENFPNSTSGKYSYFKRFKIVDGQTEIVQREKIGASIDNKLFPWFLEPEFRVGTSSLRQFLIDEFAYEFPSDENRADPTKD